MTEVIESLKQNILKANEDIARLSVGTPEHSAAVKTATEETEALFLKKKHLHLVAAICFTISVFCALMGVVNSTNDTQLASSCFMLALCAGNAVAQFVLYFKKR